MSDHTQQAAKRITEALDESGYFHIVGEPDEDGRFQLTDADGDEFTIHVEAVGMGTQPRDEEATGALEGRAEPDAARILDTVHPGEHSI